MLPLAYAQSPDFQLTTKSVQVCPYGTVQVLGYITNTGADDSFTVASESQWAKIAPDTFQLKNGEKKTVYIYVTPDNSQKSPGTYSIPVTVTGTKMKTTQTITVSLMACYAVKVSPQHSTYNSCLSEAQPVLFDITNQGKSEETFAVATNAGELTNSQVVLKSGETKTIRVTIPVTQAQQTVTIGATSLTSYAKASNSVILTGSQCYTGELSVSPVQANVCTEDVATYTVRVTNTGSRDDTYALTASAGTLANKTLTIAPGKTGQTTMTIRPTVTGSSPVEVTATSGHISVKKTATLTVDTCRGVSAALVAKQATVCQGDAAQLGLTLKNTGSRKDTYAVKTTSGTVSEKSVALNAGETKVVQVSVDTKDAVNGSYIVNATVSSTSGVSDTSSASYSISSCPNLQLGIETAENTIAACPGDALSIPVTLENVGRRADTYVLSASDGTVAPLKDPLLRPTEKKTAVWTLQTKPTETGDRKLTFTALGKTEKKELQVNLHFTSAEQCFGFTVTAEPLTQKIKSYESYDRALYKITITNTGERANTYTLGRDGPEWTLVDPKQIAVEKKQSQSAYVYMAPPFKVNEGAYEVTVHVTSAQGMTKSQKVTLFFGGDEAQTQEAPKPAGKEKQIAPVVQQIQATVGNETLTVVKGKETVGTVAYPVEGGVKIVGVSFNVGSFIMTIDGSTYTQENVSNGKHTYQIRAGSTVYRLTVDVKQAADNSYQVKMLSATVIPNAPNTAEYQTMELNVSSGRQTLQILAVGGAAIIVVLLILLWPRIKKGFVSSTVSSEKPEDEKKETKKPKKAKKTDEDRKKVKQDIEKILDSI